MSSTLSFQTRRELLQQMVPRYHQASASEKGALLDEIAATTGYARRYAMWLLNHPQDGQRSPRRRQRRYGPEVQHALFLAWHAANRVCSKRLMPFLPTLIESLERHGHLQLSETCRSQLLSMSAATADRLLHAYRTQGLRGMSTTRAGTLLKQQIPIRTFEQWNETQPGFLEADLVAHCGAQAEGSFLSTLTLTDIATGWTECLPLLSKSAEAVLTALQQARACFPFPILGLDTDNGCEFINEPLLTYCEQEGITFTRGREDLKNDQCFVEQKNGAIVRQVIGYDRLEGERTYRQLGEVYQALRLYVNGFQPSMKLQATQFDGRKVRRVYDAAKTPLQRLLLSKILSASKEHELLRVAQVLDPLRLFQHLQDLQQALFGSATSTSPDGEGTSPGELFPFCVERCLTRPRSADPGTVEGVWMQVVISANAPAPVSSAQPNQGADGNAPSFARSARAFCQWLMRHRYLQASPFARLALPKPETRVLHPLAPEEWDQMLLACRPARKIAVLAERATVRNRAILWLLFDTGMRVSELCELRLSDVDREQGTLLIRGKGARIRRLTLGHEGLRHLHAYLDTYRQEETARVEQRSASQDHLFLSETGHPLTKNGIALLFGRLRKRAGIVRGAVNPSLLRESFALRYLQTRGEPSILQELLGYPDQATSTRYQCLIARALAQQQWKGSP